MNVKDANLLNFQEINDKNAHILREYYENCDYVLCEYSLGTKLMWGGTLHPSWTEVAGCLVIRNNIDGQEVYDYPVAGPDGNEDDALTAGMAGFLPRPFLLSSLRGAIQQLNNQAPEEAEESQLSIAGLRFLAAEDNELNAEILRELLDLEGAACQIAENGQAALEMFTNAPAGTFDLILMDVQMPVMDGYAAARAIRDSSHPEAKTIPITAMTANVFDEDVQHALAAGMNAHIAKPVDMAQLKETVTELLNPTEN